MTTDRETTPSVWRMALSGLCASLIGIGLSRFAYTPLLPELIAAHWFTPAQGAYLGAANLAGYLAGALLAPAMAARVSAVVVLRAMMAVAVAAFFACAVPLSLLWLFLWRFTSGLSGGVLMVLVAPTVLPHIPPSRRGFASGAIFAGVGCGIVASGTLVPVLLHGGLVQTWCGLGAFALILTVVAWTGWPHAGRAAAPARNAPRRRPSPSLDRTLRVLYLEYGLNAVGLVPHMILLVDFITRGLGQSPDTGARDWVLFGLGAMVGPILAGHLADRIGFGPALRFAFLIQAAAVGLLAVSATPTALIVSSLIVGASVPGIVPLVLGRVHELTHGDADRQKAAWSLCTMAFALGQAAGAYGFSYLYSQTGGAYALLFALGATALTLAFAIEIVVAARTDQGALPPCPHQGFALDPPKAGGPWNP
jgi:predicted MFS family arabinose efflux permease